VWFAKTPASFIERNFRDGYIGTYTLGLDHDFGGILLSASYVGTAGVHLPSVFSPNEYAGADPAFAPFTQFNAAGQAIAGYGPESVMQSASRSSYNGLQSSLTKNSARYGLGFQASYTYSKSSTIRVPFSAAFPQMRESFCRRCRRIHVVRARKKVRRLST